VVKEFVLSANRRLDDEEVTETETGGALTSAAEAALADCSAASAAVAALANCQAAADSTGELPMTVLVVGDPEMSDEDMEAIRAQEIPIAQRTAAAYSEVSEVQTQFDMEGSDGETITGFAGPECISDDQCKLDAALKACVLIENSTKYQTCVECTSTTHCHDSDQACDLMNSQSGTYETCVDIVNGCNVVAEFTISPEDGMLEDPTEDEGQSYLNDCNDAIIDDGISSCRCVIGSKNSGAWLTVYVVCTNATVIETDAITDIHTIHEIALETNSEKNTSITYEVFTCSSPSENTNCEEVCHGNSDEEGDCAHIKESGRIRMLPNFNELEWDYYNQENHLATDPLTQENVVTDSWSQETYDATDASSMFDMRQLRDLESQAKADAQIKEVP
jgi:hypothetical protein